MSIDFNGNAATSLTIHPEPDNSRAAATAMRKPIQKATAGDNAGGSFWGAEGFGFDDLLDLINPLQHIPVVSTVYRALTGDTIAPGPRLIGGAVLGGVIGFAASAAELAFEQESGAALSTRMASAMQPEATADSAPVPIKQKQAMLTPVTMLEPLDFAAAESASLAPPVSASPALSKKTAEKSDRSDVILDLFDQETSTAHQKYNKIQSENQMLGIARDMKV